MLCRLSVHRLGIDHVHESVAQIGVPVEVAWQVHEVVETLHPLLIKPAEASEKGVERRPIN